MIYQLPLQDEFVSQADIIDNCPIFGVDQSSGSLDLESAPERWRERVIVLTQACDLLQAKASKVVVALIKPAQFLVDQGILKPATIRDQVRRGLVYGWYFLPAASSPIMFPESIIDLRDLHTIPRAALEQLIAEGNRVCRLPTPYREHLAQHFAVTYMRIGLPLPFETES